MICNSLVRSWDGGEEKKYAETSKLLVTSHWPTSGARDLTEDLYPRGIVTRKRRMVISDPRQN